MEEMMKDDFKAKRWPLPLAFLMLIVLACACVEDHETMFMDIDLDPQLTFRLTSTAHAFFWSDEGLLFRIRNEYKIWHEIIMEHRKNGVTVDSDTYKRLRDLKRAGDQLEEKIKLQKQNIDTPIAPTMQAQATDMPPALYVDTVTPRQFSMAFEYIDMHDICPPGRGRISMTLWNVGEQGGTEYGKVECAEHYPPMFQSIKGSGVETSCIEVIDYAQNMPELCVFLTFTGGENGKIINQLNNGEEIGHFIGGTTLKFYDNEIPVPDPSVFAGMQ